MTERGADEKNLNDQSFGYRKFLLFRRREIITVQVHKLNNNQ